VELLDEKKKTLRRTQVRKNRKKEEKTEIAEKWE